jgi:hypothetical protein
MNFEKLIKETQTYLGILKALREKVDSGTNYQFKYLFLKLMNEQIVIGKKL